MEEMTDWGMDELESIDWDEFGNNDDHIVPHQVTEQGNEYVAPGDIHMKPQHVENVRNGVDRRGSASKTFLCGKEEAYFRLPMKDEKSTILEDSWPHASEDAVLSCDSKLVISAFASRDAGFSDECFTECSLDTDSNLFCSNNPISGSGVSTDGTGSCNLSCDDVPPSVINVSYLEDENKSKENDLVYYDLPDIGNFDEIDQIFRNCDTTLGQGNTGSVDELSWFSSSNTIYGSEVAFASDHEKSSSLCYQSCTDWLDANAEKNKGDCAPKEQVKDGENGIKISALMQINSSNALMGHSDPDMVITHPKEMEDQSSSEVNRIQQSGDQKLLSSAVCTQNGLSQTFSKKKHLMGASSSSYVLTSNQQVQMSHLALQDLRQQRTSSIKFETTPSSYKISDNIVHHVPQCVESLADQICEPPTAGTEKLERLHHSNHLARMISENMHQPTSFLYKSSVQGRCHNYQHKIGANGKVDNINVKPTVEIDTSIIQESSCMMSVCTDDISLKVTSFQQLHDVMGQLDIRTKLCIRDSLYRLARSAKERNCFTSTNTCSSMSNDTRGIQSTEASKDRCAELLDAETVTNPIDRSIAHLLFTGLPEPITRSE